MLADRRLFLVIRWLQLTTVTVKATIHLTLIQRFHQGVFPDHTLTSGKVSGALSQAGPRHLVDRQAQTWADLGAGAERYATCRETLPGWSQLRPSHPGGLGGGDRRA